MSAQAELAAALQPAHGLALPQGVRSTSGRQGSHGSRGLSTGAAVVACPDGRSCKLCGCADNSWDPVDGEPSVRHWGYPCTPDGKTRGDFCYYCVRVHTGRYKFKWSVHWLLEEVGKSEDEMKRFKRLPESSHRQVRGKRPPGHQVSLAGFREDLGVRGACVHKDQVPGR